MARRPSGPATATSPDGTARILETGYRPYDGPRLGPRHAMWTLARHTFERILGLRRPARYKILPIITMLIAYLPAIAFIGITALVPPGRIARVVPDAGQYYSFVTAALILFSTLAAPEALCPDKRSRFLGVYLASPLTRRSYLAAKAAAVGAAISIVTIGPPLLLFAGEALQNAGPRGFPAFMNTLEQTLSAGIVLAVMFTAFSLAVPSLTDRRGFASAGSILLILGTSAITGVLAFGLKLGDAWLLLGLQRLPFEVTLRIFDRAGLPTQSGTPLSTWSVAVAAVVFTGLAIGITWRQVTHTPVTR
jgi:ABC-2 type transport system permease protein